MPPEQARGAHKEVDERSDVWSLGAMLFEILTGTHVYTGNTYEILVRLGSATPVPRASSLSPDVPVPLDGLCARARI